MTAHDTPMPIEHSYECPDCRCTRMGPFPVTDLCGCPCATCECLAVAHELSEFDEGADY